MASTKFKQSGAINLDANPSPETMYHFPMSPSEPGKFDFYRVHLANHAYYSNSTFSDYSDTPTLTAPTTTSSTEKRRWTPFADIVSSDSSKTSISNSSNTIPTSKFQTISSIDSSVLSNANSIQNEPIQSVSSSSSLTNAVKSAMNHGRFDVSSNQIRRPSSGATLSSKDLNHLSPQSM